MTSRMCGRTTVLLCAVGLSADGRTPKLSYLSSKTLVITSITPVVVGCHLPVMCGRKGGVVPSRGADRVVVASRDCVSRLELTFSQGREEAAGSGSHGRPMNASRVALISGRHLRGGGARRREALSQRGGRKEVHEVGAQSGYKHGTGSAGGKRGRRWAIEELP